MARDPGKAALGLHRFGLGPRAGTIASIASDPQGAIAAELERPNAGQIVDPALLSSAAAYRALFEFNAARAARAKLALRGVGGERGEGGTPGQNSREFGSRRAGSDAAAATQLSRRGQSADRRRPRCRNRLCRAACVVLVEPFLRQPRHLGHGRRLRARGDPPACAGPLHRHAARRREPPGDADLFERRPVDRPGFRRRHQSGQGPQREFRARDPRAAHARRAHRLYASRRDQLRQGADRLDPAAAGLRSRHRRRVCLYPARPTSRARKRCSAKPIPTPASSRAARC